MLNSLLPLVFLEAPDNSGDLIRATRRTRVAAEKRFPASQPHRSLSLRCTFLFPGSHGVPGFSGNMVFPSGQPPMIENFDFSDLREVFAKANEEKSGDQLAGIAARSERERVAAKRKLADLTLGEIVRRPLIDPSEDNVTRLILDSFDQEAFRPVRAMTVGEFREFLLEDTTGEEELRQLQRGIPPEIAAAVAKLMSNKDLVLAASKI